ncbi:hypothetical protein [Aquimarina aquimarini]|uniref:hypothetical protein n=1 Tax=Aquimarina aquimarini TaxID=1191734 RepID=UPI000D55FD38|nr:hypothetical protein [Aquimarina aquimarini]
MHDSQQINELLESVFNHDVKVKLNSLDDPKRHKDNVPVYQQMLMTMVRIGHEAIERENYNPSILLLDADEKIICNDRFEILLTENANASENADITIDLIYDYCDANSLYYVFPSSPDYYDGVIFSEHFEVPTQIDDLNYEDYYDILFQIIQINRNKEWFPKDINCGLTLHAIDFENKIWRIKEF